MRIERLIKGRARWPGFLCTGGVLVLLSLCGSAQQVGVMKGFKFAEHYPQNQTQVKSLLEGERAQRLTNGQYQVTSVRLQTFRTNGDPEIKVVAPECLHDPVRRTVRSAGALHVQTADGKFSIDGQGFLWQQTNSILTISNQVRTSIDPALLEQSREANATSPEGAAGGIQVLADQFNYAADAGEGVYSGNVRVISTNASLASRLLTLKLPMKERQLQSITAEQNVSLDYSGMKATGQKALYELATGLVYVSGNPEWSGEGREGGADEFILDRTNRTVRALGLARLRLPVPKTASGGFLATDARLAAPGTSPDSSASEGPQRIEVLSRDYILSTNAGTFHGPVELTRLSGEKVQGKLTCEVLDVAFAGTNELQTLVAEQNVVIRQEADDMEFNSTKALYTATNGMLRLTGNPKWRAGEREGKGDLILVNGQKNEMLVSGNASMRVPAAELGQASPAVAQEQKAAGSPAAPDEKFADVFSEDYTFRSESADFRGGVYISHPRMWWACQEMTIASPAGPTKTNTVTALRSVAFDLVDERGQKVQGKGEKAVYTFTTGGATNEILELTGNPVLVTTNGTFRNRIIILDRAKNKVFAPGRYALRGSSQALGTNVFRLPSARFKR
jgi:lipopolysaccharide export system protein LptA